MQKKVLIGYSIVSPLHLINFLTFLNSNKNNFDKVYVFFSIYWSNAIIPERYVQYCKNKNIIVVFNDLEKKEIFKKIYKNNCDITFVCVKSPSIKIMFKQVFYKNIKNMVVIDEGLSSYAGYMHSVKAVVREKNIYFLFKFFIISIIIYVLSNLNRKKVARYSAFSKQEIGLNRDYKNNFSEVLYSIGKMNKCGFNYSDSILFCTQPWVDLGVMDAVNYKILLENLKIKIEKKGCKLLIKKHPADMVFDYDGFDVLDFDGIVEELVLIKEFSGLISMCSTSSILVSSCFNIKSYLLSFDDLKNMDKNLQRLFKYYCIDFNGL